MYYPLSQITPNLHTNGGEFIYSSSSQPYVGNYWSTSSGKYYTGKTPQDLPTEEIIKLSASSIKETFDSISNTPSFYNQDDLSPVEYINLTNPPPPQFSSILLSNNSHSTRLSNRRI